MNHSKRLGKLSFSKFKKYLKKVGDERKPEDIYTSLGGKLPK